MIIVLDNKYNIIKTTDENIVKGSDDYNSIILKVPIECTNYYPTATFKRPDGKRIGPLICSQQKTKTLYKIYQWILGSNVLAINGTLQITFSINFVDENGNTIEKKNVAEAFSEIYDAVVVNDAILIGGQDAIENLTNRLYVIQQNLNSYNEKWDEKVDKVATINGNSDIITRNTTNTKINIKSTSLGSLQLRVDDNTKSSNGYVNIDKNQVEIGANGEYSSDMHTLKVNQQGIYHVYVNDGSEREMLDTSMAIDIEKFFEDLENPKAKVKRKRSVI